MKNKYMLIAQINNEQKEINWEKITPFESFKKGKYRLQNIDFFTSHYKNYGQLLIALVNNNCLTLSQLHKVKIMIMNCSDKSNETNNLSLELIYKQSQKYLLEDYQTLLLLYELLNEFEFINILYNFYVTNGQYNARSINILNSRIEQIKEKIEKGYKNLKGIYIGLIKERNNLQSSFTLLSQIYNYSKAVSQNVSMSLKEENLAKTYMEEFFYREKYYVIGSKQGNYDKQILSYRTNKNHEKCVNELQFHNLLILIQNYLENKETPQLNTSPLKKLIKDDEIPGQLRFF